MPLRGCNDIINYDVKGRMDCKGHKKPKIALLAQNTQINTYVVFMLQLYYHVVTKKKGCLFQAG